MRVSLFHYFLSMGLKAQEHTELQVEWEIWMVGKKLIIK
jgi:hypothetical protein